MSLIKTVNEIDVDRKIKILIYGKAGTGKTTLALSAPKPVLFDFDDGVHRVSPDHLKDVGIVQIKSYQHFLDALNDPVLSDYESIVIDTGGKLLDFMAQYIINNDYKMGKYNGTLTLQGYGERKILFSNIVDKISSLKKHIIFVAHQQMKQDGDDFKYLPLFGGSNYDDLVTKLDMMGYVEMFGKKRTINFDPTKTHDGKNMCNLPSMNLPVVVGDKGNSVGDNNFMDKKIFSSYYERLNKINIEKSKYDDLLKDIHSKIDSISSLSQINDFIKNIDSFNHIGNSKLVAGQSLNQKAKSLGFVFDKTKKTYKSDNKVEKTKV